MQNSANLKVELNTQFNQCSSRLLEVEERLQETQKIGL